MICNKRSVVRIRGFLFFVAFISLISAVSQCRSQNSLPSRGPTIFDEPPLPMYCADRPAPLPPGEHSFLAVSPQAPYARTRLDKLDLPLYQVPALTIAAQPFNDIQIAAASQDHWSLHFCAMGEGTTAEEANGYMQRISMQRTGSLLTLNNTDAHGLVGGRGTLHVEAPTEAPVTVHSDGGVRVYEMAAPVRISAGMAVILNTSGLVDASASQIFFGGSQGSVALSASWDIHIKLTAQQFHGKLRAYAQRQVRVHFPSGFQTPVSVVVNRPRDFVCHADFCSTIKKDRENSLYVFTYGEVANASDRINLRSENAQVTLDTVQ